MNSFKFCDSRAEKANAISRYSRVKRIATLLRFVELFVFVIVVFRFFTQFSFTPKLSGEYFRGISVFIISPQFVFVVGNAIVVFLFVKSGRFSSKNGDKTDDFYEEYAEKCRTNQHAPAVYEYKSDERKIRRSQSENQQSPDVYGYKTDEREIRRSQSENQRSPDVYEYISNVKKMCRSQSDLERPVRVAERRSVLRRSVTERFRKSVSSGRKGTAPAVKVEKSSYKEDDMSSEEFRRTVEAFIARQQRCLREEEDISPVVSVKA